MLKFTATELSIDAAADDTPTRTITGLAVPWNVTTTDSLGQKVRFERNSLPEDGRAPKLAENHDLGRIVGIVTERVSTEQGLMFTAKIAETSAGNDALELLKMGAIDAVSVGVQPTKYKHGKDGTLIVEAGTFHELSLVAVPAFEDARIHQVAAAAPEDDENDDTEPQEKEECMETTEIEAAAPAPVTIPTEPLWAQPKRDFRMPTAAEYISAYLGGGHEFAALLDKIRAAAPEVGTADTPGILPTPIVGPVYNSLRGLRPVIDAIGTKAMPASGKVFIRPEVTTHTSIAQQAAEFDTLQAGTFVVTDNQVTKLTVGGYVQISEQDLSWTSPEVLSLILDDMARQYAKQTDNIAADNLVSGASSTTNFTVASIADPAEWARWVYVASEEILTATDYLPTHLFLSPNMWRSLGLLVDTADRPLFPMTGPMNAFGSMNPGQTDNVAFGLRVVVDSNFANDTVIVGHADGYEIFEQQRGALSIDNPSNLSRTIAFRGNFATLMIDVAKFRKAAFV